MVKNLKNCHIVDWWCYWSAGPGLHWWPPLCKLTESQQPVGPFARHRYLQAWPSGREGDRPSSQLCQAVAAILSSKTQQLAILDHLWTKIARFEINVLWLLFPRHINGSNKVIKMRKKKMARLLCRRHTTDIATYRLNRLGGQFSENAR